MIFASSLSPLDTGAVERPAPGLAPTAFRIWKAGDNATDFGVHKFTQRSAKLLIDEQATRQNLFSIDIDHLSLNPLAPTASHSAAGWHALEVRQSAAGPELWATALEWSQEARAALEAEPPGFRYISPAYDVDPKTSEITGYLNLALTNVPASHGVTALASHSSPGAPGERERLLRTVPDEDVRRALKNASLETISEVARRYPGNAAADEQRREMRRRMGLEPSRGVHFEGRALVFPATTRQQHLSRVVGAMTPAQRTMARRFGNPTDEARVQLRGSVQTFSVSGRGK